MKEFEENLKFVKSEKCNGKSIYEILIQLRQKQISFNQACALIADSEFLKVSEARKIIMDSGLWKDDIDQIIKDTNEFMDEINKDDE
jgi:hypothetical protein